MRVGHEDLLNRRPSGVYDLTSTYEGICPPSGVRAYKSRSDSYGVFPARAETENATKKRHGNASTRENHGGKLRKSHTETSADYQTPRETYRRASQSSHQGPTLARIRQHD